MLDRSFFTISTAEHLRSLLVGPFPLDPLKFEIPEISKDEHEFWSQRLNKNFYACGCNEATALVIIGVAVSLGFGLVEWFSELDFSWWHYVLILVTFAFLAGLLKTIIVKMSRRNLMRDVNDLLARLSADPISPRKKIGGEGDD